MEVLFGMILYSPLAIILIVYFVKVARRACSLMEVLHREAEWRLRLDHELPPPTDPIIEESTSPT
jgi:hypothetical protein